MERRGASIARSTAGKCDLGRLDARHSDQYDFALYDGIHDRSTSNQNIKETHENCDIDSNDSQAIQAISLLAQSYRYSFCVTKPDTRLITQTHIMLR